MKLFAVVLLFFLPTIANAQPFLLSENNAPSVAYGANGQRYDVLPSLLGSVVYGPNGGRIDVFKKESGGAVGYDQNGVRVFENYPSPDPASTSK